MLNAIVHKLLFKNVISRYGGTLTPIKVTEVKKNILRGFIWLSFSLSNMFYLFNINIKKLRWANRTLLISQGNINMLKNFIVK